MCGARPGLTVAVCCSVFQAEVDQCLKTHWPSLPVTYLSSMLHMRPDRLAAQLHSTVGKELRQGHQVLLVYGDCCAGMTAIESQQGVARTGGTNCVEIMLGQEEYRRLSHEGAFFLYPEWADRWQEIFEIELGLDSHTTRNFMQDMHRKLVYLDTGLKPVPTDTLRACSDYCGLPWEVYTIAPDSLYHSIREALLRMPAARTPS